MLAAMATAVPLPKVSLISLVTWSQTSCLREDTTTLAPCSAIRSAMARPMPRVEPVMTATFPFMSNKVMRLSPVMFRRVGKGAASRRAHHLLRTTSWWARHRTHSRSVALPTLRQFCRHHFRARRLMHRGVRGVGDPWLLVDEGNPPAAVAAARKMIEPGDRAIVDGESEALFRLIAKRNADRGLDGAAMRDRDDVAAGVREVDAFDRTADAVVQIHETFPVRRRLVDRGEPVAAEFD